MSDIAAQVSAARAQVEAASRGQARAEADAAAARAEAGRVMAQLSEEFGVDSAEEAEALLSELERQVREQLTQVSQGLAEAGEEQS